jgi:hypothetical protein
MNLPNSAYTLDRYLARPGTGEVLSSGSEFFDRAFEGLRCGNIYLLVSQRGFAEYFVYRAMIRNILQHDGEVVFIDCGNSFDPYSMARMYREHGIEEKAVLRRILISRPFTAYQLNTLFNEMLRKVLGRKPLMLVFSRLLELFHSGDVEEKDVDIILPRVLRELKALASKDFPILLTHRGLRRRRYLSQLALAADAVYTFQVAGKHRIRVRVEKDPVLSPGVSDFFFACGPQTTLEEYGGENGWAEPSPRTGNSWRMR